MLQPIAIMEYLAPALLDAASDGVTPKAIIYALAGAVTGLAGAVAAMGMYIAKASKRHQEKVDDLYESRIKDLKEAHDLVDTLIKVLNPRKGEGGP